MKKLIEALHVIQETCNKHKNENNNFACEDCPLGSENGICCVIDLVPAHWKINDEVQKALL